MAVKKELRAIISADDRKFQRTMAKVKRAAWDTGKALAQIGAVGGAAFLAATKITADYADEIDKTSLRLGLTIEQYQRLKLAGAQAGLTTEQLSMAMQSLSKNIGGALGGDMGQIKALSQIGIKLRDIRGKDAQEQLMMVGNALSKIEDQNRKMKLAGQLFGDEAGARMMVMFANGADGVADAMNRIDAKGLLSEKQVRDATRLNDQLTVTKAIMMGGLATLLADTWPIMQEGIAEATGEMQKLMQSAEFENVRTELQAITSELIVLGREILPLVKAGMDGVSDSRFLSNAIKGASDLIGLLNDLNDMMQMKAEENLNEGIHVDGATASTGRAIKEEAGFMAARAQRLMMGDVGVVQEYNQQVMGQAERAADKIIGFLSKGPLGEGK